jgi:KDO2-lipid IV(A) lauroyltransferase
MADPVNGFARRLRHLAEAALARLLVGFFRLLDIDEASAVGGAIGRTIGPRLGISRRAARNIRRVLPEKTEAEVTAIILGMWDNLGRTMAEFTQLDRFDIHNDRERFEIVGRENLIAMCEDGVGGFFYSAHFGNWEVLLLTAVQIGIPLHAVYRAPNNPYVDDLTCRLRGPREGYTFIPKGPSGARALLGAIKNGGHIALLNDQKMNDGVAVPFFGIDAMTAPALAQLALRFDAPVVAAHTERIKGARFRITFDEPMRFENTGDKEADIKAALEHVNNQIETWIRERPEQWLWLHRRWPDE